MASKSGIEWTKLFFTSVLFVLSRCVIVIHCQSSRTCDGNYTNADDRALCEYLLDPLVEGEFSQQCNVLKNAEWKYTTNVSAETKSHYSEAYKKFLEYSSLVQIDALSNFNGVYEKFGTRKAAQILTTMGPNKMSPTNYNRMRDIEIRMQNDYDATTVCRLGTNCVDMNLIEVKQLMKDSTSMSEREYYYKAWNEELAKKITVEDYSELVRLQNEYARSNGFISMSHMLLEPYNDGSVNWTAKSFLDEMEAAWESTLKPNFEATRKFTTDRLRSLTEYENRIDLDNNIHINLLNDLWGEDWSILAEKTKPFTFSSTLDILATNEMLKLQKDANKMFNDANRMMTKIGLENLLQIKYGWGESIINKTEVAPDEIICEPQSIDFCEDPFSYRVRMCPEVNLRDLVTIHEELGKVEYFFAYKHLPYVFRSGVNPGMPLGLAKALGLAAQSPKYLNCYLKFYLGENLKFCDLGIPTTPSPATSSPTTEAPETTTEDTSGSPLPFSFDKLDNFDFNSEDTEVDNVEMVQENNERNLDRAFRTNIQNEEVNYLYKLKLKYFYASYALAVEKWRWEVFNGLPSADYNKRWWELRKEFQGVVSPELPNTGLHAASKFDIINYKSYIDEFVSHIVQFQIFENLCILAGEYDKNDPEKKFLHRCILSEASIPMGDIIYDIMGKGAEVPWPETLKNLTGSETILPGSIEDFFGPVKEAIDEVNRPGKGSTIGFIIGGVIIAGAMAACCIGILVGRRSRKRKDKKQNVEFDGFYRSR